MLFLTRVFEFSASHATRNANWSDAKNLEVFGKCTNPHGHNYRLEVTVSGSVNPETGMLINAKTLDRLVDEWAIESIDHKDLTKDVPWMVGKIPTTENVVEWLWERIDPLIAALAEKIQLEKITLWETRKIAVTKTRN